MADFTKAVSFEEPQNNEEARLKIADNPFLSSDTGKIFLPSLLSKEEEENFSIKRNFTQKGYSGLRDSVWHIYNYEIADQYNYVLTQLSDEDLYWLKFIAKFKSVQKVQIERQAMLYPNMLNKNRANQSLKSLFRYGLIWKWDFKRDFQDHPIKVYTLTSNGFRFLEYLFDGERKYFHPQSFFSIDPKFHIRFWETVDIYQLMLSLPIYKDYDTFFSLGKISPEASDVGISRRLNSPLQESIELIPGKTNNLVIFPALQTDNNDYYMDAITKWNDFTQVGKFLSKPINNLPKGQNILTFYAPTVKVANRLNEKIKLPNWRFPVFFLIGSVIEKYGVTSAFYIPDSKKKTLDLLQFKLPNLVQDTGKDEENEA